jgi:hypothetical protein
MEMGDAHAFVMGEGMGYALTFVIKGDVCAFVIGEGMGYALTIVTKGDAPLATHVSFAFIIEDAH